MNSRSNKYRNSMKNRSILISIFSITLVIALSLFVSNKLASLIYKQSVVKITENTENTENTKLSNDTKSDNINKKNNVDDSENYKNSLLNDNIVLFQGGVFTDLENAEEFKNKIKDKTLVSIVNDGKYERIILGISNKKHYTDMTNIYKKNNIQFVKQLYKIPTNVKYNSEILDIVNIFVDFLLKNQDSLSKNEFNTVKLKSKVSEIQADYGKEGSSKNFNDLKDLILELDDKCDAESIESVVDFIYSNFKQYKV